MDTLKYRFASYEKLFPEIPSFYQLGKLDFCPPGWQTLKSSAGWE